MRIKKIEWITIDDKSDPSSPVGKLVKTADLPIGCVALIRQYQACYRWMIKVVDLSVAFLPPIEVGETDSIEGAKKACQATWEKMVKEALEPIALYVISTEEGIDSICTSADEAKLRQQEVMACSGCMEGFVIVEEFVVDLDGNVTEVEYEE